jgi:hypothetical protein
MLGQMQRRLYITGRQDRGRDVRLRIRLTGLVASVLALIGLETLLVFWLYHLPVSPVSLGPPAALLRLAEPAILLVHPKGPLCLPLVMAGAAIATACRDLAELTRSRGEEVQRRVGEVQRTVAHAYLLAGFTAAMALILRSKG